MLDRHFQVYRSLRGFAVNRFGTQGIGLAVQLLHQKIQPPAAGATVGQRIAHFVDVGHQPVQLFINVHFLCQQHNFLLDALIVDSQLQLGKTVQQFLFLAGDNRRQRSAHLLADGFDALQALFDQQAQLLTLTPAVLKQLGQRLVKTGQQCLFHSCPIQLDRFNHARPLQKGTGLLGGNLRQQVGNLLVGCQQFFQQRLVNVDMATLCIKPVKAQCAFDLATRQVFSQLVAQQVFTGAGNLRQPE